MGVAVYTILQKQVLFRGNAYKVTYSYGGPEAGVAPILFQAMAISTTKISATWFPVT